MNERLYTRKYTVTVEGETEQWYFDWLGKQINACETASLPNTPLEPLPAESGQTAQAIAPAAAPADEPATQPSRRSLLELSAADTVLPPPATTVPAEVPVSSSSYEFISPLAAARPREYSPEPAEPPSAPPAAEFPMVENPLAGIPPIQDVSATAIDTERARRCTCAGSAC